MEFFLEFYRKFSQKIWFEFCEFRENGFSKIFAKIIEILDFEPNFQKLIEISRKRLNENLETRDQKGEISLDISKFQVFIMEEIIVTF